MLKGWLNEEHCDVATSAELRKAECALLLATFLCQKRKEGSLLRVGMTRIREHYQKCCMCKTKDFLLRQTLFRKTELFRVSNYPHPTRSTRSYNNANKNRKGATLRSPTLNYSYVCISFTCFYYSTADCLETAPPGSCPRARKISSLSAEN